MATLSVTVEPCADVRIRLSGILRSADIDGVLGVLDDLERRLMDPADRLEAVDFYDLGSVAAANNLRFRCANS